MRKWDDLSMREKAEMMRVAVSNGITTLPEIKQAYNEFAEGGAMPEAQPAENDGWSMEDEVKYREWRSKLPYNLRNTNDNDYDMREAYKAGMQPTLEDDGFYHLGSRNPKTGRILKAPHHPTYLKAINTDARMGYYPRTEKGITYTDTWEGNLFGGGGYKPSERIKQRIAHYEGKAMTGATDPLSGKWAKNNSFESEAKNFYNALPRDIREQVLSNPELADSLYSYSYNVGAGRFKERVVPALRNYYNGKGTVQDIENSMWASGDSKLRGLQRRRAEERKGVRNALIGDVPYLPSDTPSYPTIYDMPQYIPAQPQAFSAPLTSYQPVMLPDEQQPIVREAMAYDPKEIERQERQRGLNNFMTLMSMTSPQESGNPYLDTIGMLAGNQFKKGGRIYIKPKNRGKFTKLKERTGHSATWFKEHGTPAQKKMAIFALNARHWKHGDGGNLFSGEDTPTQKIQKRHVTTGGAGYIPDYSTHNSIDGLKKAVYDYYTGGLPVEEVRNRLYNNVSPYGYFDVSHRIRSAVRDNIPFKKSDDTGYFEDLREGKDPKIDSRGYSPKRDDIFAEYLQIPKNKRHSFPNNSGVKLIKSKYVPTIGKENNSYLALKLPDNYKESLVRAGENVPMGKNQLFVTKPLGDFLGEHTVGKGYDSKGEYVSYYDRWDLDPFFYGQGERDITMGIGKPVNIYDRIYLDDYYGIKQPTHATYLPEVTVYGKKKKK